MIKNDLLIVIVCLTFVYAFYDTYRRLKGKNLYELQKHFAKDDGSRDWKAINRWVWRGFVKDLEWTIPLWLGLVALYYLTK